jgi:hypothetical protein
MWLPGAGSDLLAAPGIRRTRRHIVVAVTNWCQTVPFDVIETCPALNARDEDEDSDGQDGYA